MDNIFKDCLQILGKFIILLIESCNILKKLDWFTLKSYW